jgi:hypothetical protein
VATNLLAEEGGAVEFDTRVGPRNGGGCGVMQRVRRMIFRKMESGVLFFCSNQGPFANEYCSNSTRVTVTFQGPSKYDFKLRLDNISMDDVGRYQVEVELDGLFGMGGRVADPIYKEFLVALKPVEVVPPSILHPIVTRLDNGAYQVHWETTSGSDDIIYHLNVLETNFTDSVKAMYYQLPASECPCTGCSLSIAAENSLGWGNPVEVDLRPLSAQGTSVNTLHE